MKQAQRVLACSLLLAVQSAHAENMGSISLESLSKLEVSGASRFTQRLTDAPSNVTLITSEDIRTSGYRNLSDILRSVRGVYVSSDQSYDYLGVRGFLRPGDYNTRVLMLIDGYPYTDPVYQQSLLLGTLGLIDVDMIERVEFIPGPGSAVYGSNAFFGVVNIITKHPGEISRGLASVSAASNDTYEGKLALAGKSENGLEWLGSATRYRSLGQDWYYPAFSAINNGVAQGLDVDSNHRLFGKLLWGPLMLELSHVRRDKGVPGAPYGDQFNDPRARYIDEVSFADLRYQNSFGDYLNLSGRVYYGDYKYQGYYPYDAPPTVVTYDASHARWYGAEGMVTWLGWENHQVSSGFEFENDPRMDQYTADTSPVYLYLDDRRDSSRYGVFLQDEWRFRPNWILNAGVRHDHYSYSVGNTSPRLALIRQSDQDSYKLLYGSAFRMPSAFEMYYNDGGLTQIANPNLMPETIATWELSWERRWGDGLRTLASVYRNHIEDLITQIDTGGGVVQYQNVTPMTARGIELETEYAWRNGMRIKSSYAIQRTEYDTGANATNSPKQLFKLNFITPLAHGIQLGSELQAMSARDTKSSQVGPHAVANLTLSGGDPGGLSWSASAYNLFDHEYSDPAGAEFVQDALPQGGRQLRLKLDWHF